MQQSAWKYALSIGEYWPEGSQENFIHCSFKEQVLTSANKYFKGQSELIVLEIDFKKVEEDLKIESNVVSGDRYPHLYRKLKTSEVRAEHTLTPSEDGTFQSFL